MNLEGNTLHLSADQQRLADIVSTLRSWQSALDSSEFVDDWHDEFATAIAACEHAADVIVGASERRDYAAMFDFDTAITNARKLRARVVKSGDWALAT